MTLKIQKHLDEAVAYCTKALQLAPDSADTYVTLGAILADQGKLEEAVVRFRHSLRIEPRHIEAWVKLATALREQGRLDSALAHLEHALRLPPLYLPLASGGDTEGGAEAHYQLGMALAEQEKPDEAIRHYREALRLKPDWVPALSHLGILLEESGQTEEGRRLVERALTLGPEQVPVRVNCGISLANQGRLPEAREQFLKALSVDPDCPAAYFFLARESKHSFSPAEIGRIKDLLSRDGLPLRDRINLHFTMARILDHDKAYDDAFRHCERANACKRELLRLQGNTFRADIHHRFVDRLTATFDHDYFRRTQDFGTPSDLPVFIVGMPRSGTSLVEQILASHPSVHGAGEIPALRQLVATLPAELGTSADYPECLSRLDRQTSRRLADQYLERLRQLGGEKLRVTDKVPMNFHQLGLIGTLFPRAQIIHCRRDPRDISWSCYFQNFREVHFACDLAMLGAYYREYERLMAHWKAVLPVSVLEVCYEELVEDVERVSRQIVSFCRLPWHDACLSFYETRRMVRTASNTQVRRPIYKDSLGKWKNYASHLGPLFTALGEVNEPT
jgi:tetratricopeptide (TPR) repeat protein